MENSIRVAVGQLRELTDHDLQFAAQMGVKGVQLNGPNVPGEKRWEYMDLLQLRMRAEDAGLKLEALENTPLSFYDHAMLGLPGRDEQIEDYQETIRNVGRAGIPILGFHWMPNQVWRTSQTTPGRGGSKVTSFDMELAKTSPATHGREYTAEELWETYCYFIDAVVPVAEEAGISLALHPDDPPVASLGGVARIMNSFDNFKRAMEYRDSPNLGLDFCMGCWSEMMGAGCLEAMEYFGPRGKILYVHFRDVQGLVPKFQECFLGEGNVNLTRALLTLRKTGFNGFLIDDHVPAIVGDTPYGHRARAHAIGHMTGLLAAIDELA